MSLAPAKLNSPFHHCRLCTKAYSSEKSLNKHLRKKHADARHSAKDQSSADLANLDSGSSDDRLPKSHDLLTLSVPLAASRSGLGLGGSTRRLPIDEDLVIVCPECNGTIKSKKGVAKHYMCFHNAVYAAWKSGWFGRSVRLMDLTREMISEFYASGGPNRDEHGPAAVANAASGVNDDKSKDRPPEGKEVDLGGGMVLDSVQEADDAESNLSGRSAGELLRISQKSGAPTDLVGRGYSGAPLNSASIRHKRSKLKTQIATTAPFFTNKDGKLEFNSNENPLDINCPFCITHKTTIKGLAKHCVNHHPREYGDWKCGNFGSVQLRYVRPNSSVLSQTLVELGQQQLPDAATRKSSPLPTDPRSASPSAGKRQKTLQNTTTGPICGPSVKPDDFDANYEATRHASSEPDDATVDDSGSVTPPSVAGTTKEKLLGTVASGLNLYEDDKQATPCPFCGELIFSKGMGKHCIYFHHDQYQEWKSGKYGSVPLRFVPSQVGCDMSELSERALKRREARKKNGISITLPLTEGGGGIGQQAATPTPEVAGAEVTMRIKPSPFRGEIHRCSECGREFDKSSSLSQHLRIHKYGPSMSKHGFQTQAAWGDDTDESSDGGDLLEYEDATFVCHYCESIFNSADELKLHFGQKHPEDAINERRSLFVLGEVAADEAVTAECSGEAVADTAKRALRFVCDICHSLHRSKRSLGRHYRGHRLEKFSSLLFDDKAGGRRSEADAVDADEDAGEAEVAETDEEEDATDEAEREPGELSPQSGSVGTGPDESAGRQPEKHFCSVCKSCFPSARSLAQHYRVHKFGSASRGANAPWAASAAASTVNDGDDKDSEEDLDIDGGGRLQISDWNVAEDANNENEVEGGKPKDTAEKPAGCPKCGKAFRNRLFLRDHFRRCFARALADGELDMHDLETLAFVSASADGPAADCDQEPDEIGKMSPSPGSAKAFECPQCGKAFSTQANLMKHNVVHTGSSVSCKFCLREFKMPCHLARHFCSATQPDQHQPQNRTQHRSQHQLNQPQHQQQNHPPHQPQPQQHQRSHQLDSLEPEGSHECDLCHQTFRYAGNLTVHRRFCQQLHPRSERNESEDSQQQMILLDCEDEVHECSLCNETFADKESLDRHAIDCSLKPVAAAAAAAVVTVAAAAPPRASGGGSQPFQRERIPCPNCAKTYCRKDVLEAHLKTSCRGHLPTAAPTDAGTFTGGPPPMKRPRQDGPLTAGADRAALSFRCELCPSQFSSSLGLVVHRSKCHPQFYGPSHRRAGVAASAAAATPVVGDEAFECNACHRRFVRATQLEKHRFMCPAYIRASIAASAAAASAAAAAADTGEQGPLLSLPNRCPRCPRAFLTAGRLQEHVLAVHGGRGGGGDGDIRVCQELRPPPQLMSVAAAANDNVDNDDDDDEPKGDGGLLLDDADVADVDVDADPAGEAQAAAAAFADANEEAMDTEYPGADAYLCSECDRSYPTFDRLNRHLMEAHDIDAVTPELPVADAAEAAPSPDDAGAAVAVVLHPLQLTAALTGARKRKSTPFSMC